MIGRCRCESICKTCYLVPATFQLLPLFAGLHCVAGVPTAVDDLSEENCKQLKHLLQCLRVTN